MIDRGTLLIAGLSILSLISSYWIYVTFAPSYIGLIYAGMSVLALIICVGAKPIGKALGNNAVANKTQELHFGKQLLLGLIVGAFFLALAFTGFSIGVPTVQYATGGSTFLSSAGTNIVKIFAALPEELFFFFTIPFLLYSFFVGVAKSKFLAMIGSIILSSILFSLYHYRAYGATALLSGAFIAAGGFRLVVLLIDGFKGKAFTKGFEPSTIAPVLITAIVMHALFNLATVVKTLVVAA